MLWVVIVVKLSCRYKFKIVFSFSSEFSSSFWSSCRRSRRSPRQPSDCLTRLYRTYRPVDLFLNERIHHIFQFDFSEHSNQSQTQTISIESSNPGNRTVKNWCIILWYYHHNTLHNYLVDWRYNKRYCLFSRIILISSNSSPRPPNILKTEFYGNLAFEVIGENVNTTCSDKAVHIPSKKICINFVKNK